MIVATLGLVVADIGLTANDRSDLGSYLVFHQSTSANKHPRKRYCRNILSEICLNNYIQLFSEQNRTEVISFLYDTLPYMTRYYVAAMAVIGGEQFICAYCMQGISVYLIKCDI